MIGDSIYRENAALVGGSPQQVHEQLWSQGGRKRLKRRLIVTAVILVVGWKTGHLWFGVAAAGLYLLHQFATHVKRRMETSVWRQGLTGARRTSRTLRLLEYRGYRVLHNRVIPGYGTIPHLVVGPGRVWLVENEVHDPETDLIAIKGRLFVGKDVKTHVVAKLEKTAQGVSEHLSSRMQLPVKAAVVVAVHGGRPKAAQMTAGGVVLMRPWRIPGYLLKTASPQGVPVEDIVRTILREFGPSSSRAAF